MYNRGSEGKGRGFGFGGFSMKPGPKKGVGIETQLAQMGYTGGRGYGYGGHTTNIGKKRVRSEEEYFDDDEEETPKPSTVDLEYLPAPGSPSYKSGHHSDDSDASEDPLEAFMAGIEKQVEHQSSSSTDKKDKGDGKKSKKGVRDDIEGEDEIEAYMRYMEENPNAGVNLDEDEPYEYDVEGNIIIPDHKKVIDPLPPIDHSDIDYDRFNKNFYIEHEDISKLSHQQVLELRSKLSIRVSGYNVPHPVSSFGHFGFDDQLLKVIRKSEYTQPTPIQSQAIPIGLMGRDIIGIAKTGSGKTAAFVWPLLVHIMDQAELKPGEGPIGLILAPTRELSQQIYHEAKKFGKAYNIKVVCAYGGGSMWEQQKACEEGAEIIVATPGRLIDLIKKKSTNLTRVTYLVFDEADRMFDMGFEPQVRSIANHVRPERQTMLFSATFKRKVERLCRDILTDPLKVVQGELGEANEDITQYVKIMQPGPSKWMWLNSRLVEFTSVGSVLIFVTRKANSEELAQNLRSKDYKVALIHGDMDQTERNKVITSFKKKEVPILVATDVAARGLDIPSIKYVVNYDVARDIDTHTHRIGRTGRAGEKGTAFTLVTPKDKDFAAHLVRNLEGAGQFVPEDLLDLAMQNAWFKKSRSWGKAKKMNTVSGLGFRERPGLGAANAGSSGGSSGFSAYTPAQSSGPQSDRVAAMRSAFQAQFKSNFVGSSDGVSNEWSQESAAHSGIGLPPTNPESKKRKKTRWDV